MRRREQPLGLVGVSPVTKILRLPVSACGRPSKLQAQLRRSTYTLSLYGVQDKDPPY